MVAVTSQNQKGITHTRGVSQKTMGKKARHPIRYNDQLTISCSPRNHKAGGHTGNFVNARPPSTTSRAQAHEVFLVHPFQQRPTTSALPSQNR
jgi:hypothetical protein